jgi:hypothetical protein
MFNFNETERMMLNEMSFIDYLKCMLYEIKKIKHVPNSDSAYTECKTRILHINDRIEKENCNFLEESNIKAEIFDLSESGKILLKYHYSSGESKKRKVIKEFISEYTSDLVHFITVVKTLRK